MIKGKKRTRKHKGKGLKDDEKESGTIFNANINTCKHAKCWYTTYVISTREVDERKKPKDQERA
jgi:hypothetical protein